jgi:hypothetical protein
MSPFIDKRDKSQDKVIQNRISAVFATLVLFLYSGSLSSAAESAPYRFPEKDKQRDIVFDTVADFNVGDYGARGDGKTDDGPALRKALSALIASGKPAKLIFEKKTYRLDKRSDDGYNINLTGVKNIKIEGNGATLILHPDNSLLKIYQSKNIIVRDLNVDYNPLTWTQGKVLSVDKMKGTARVSISNGFPHPDPKLVKLKLLYARMDPKTRATVRNHYKFPIYTPLTKITPEGKGQFLFTFANKKICGDMKVGEGFIYKLVKGMHLNTITESENVLYENMTVHATRNFGFAGGRNKGDLIFRKIQFIRKPGRYVSTLGDGLHFKGNEKGPLIEDSYFEGVWDDKLHLALMVDAVTKIHSDKKFTIRSTQGGNESPELQVGDKMLFYNFGKGTYLGSSEIVRIDAKHPKARYRTITVKDSVKGVIPAADIGNKNGMGLNISKFTICYTERHSGKGAVIRRNTFDLFHRHPIILRTPEAVFEDNEIIGSGQSVGIKVGNSHIGEWPVPYNIEISNNKLTDNLLWGIWINSTYSPKTKPGKGWTRNITVENNTLKNQYANAIRLDKVSHVWLKGNTVEMASDADPKFAPYVENLSTNVRGQKLFENDSNE